MLSVPSKARERREEEGFGSVAVMNAQENPHRAMAGSEVFIRKLLGLCQLRERGTP